MAFQMAEDELRAKFIPALFMGATSQIPRRAITNIPTKQYGIAPPDPNQTARDNWMASCIITCRLVAAIHGTDEFRSGDHILLIE